MDKKSRELVMGKLYFKNKDYKMAEKSFLDYLTTHPEDFQALKLLAQVYEHLRNFPKAYELYERCYLVEPDRKGVLLDLCRLLLMDEPSLSRTDQHKWLQLALQAFPANPIVLSLKSSLPAHEPKQEKGPSENAIIEKLCAIDNRLAGIEKKIAGIEKKLCDLEIKPKTIEKNTADPEIKPKAIEKKTADPDIKPKAIEKKTADPEIKPTAIEKKIADLEIQPKPIDKPAPITSSGGFSGFGGGFSGFGGGSSGFGGGSSVFGSGSSSIGTGNIFGSATQAPPTTLFNPSTEAGSPNLFSQALQKLNMPTETPWLNGGGGGSSSVVKNDDQGDQDEGGDEENDDERVPVEELPIENNCDLEAIEIKTGEEDEEIVFEERCKLYRFRDKEYKERGLGQIKILRHKETGKGRVIMRREAINKVCLNCWTISNVHSVDNHKTRFAGLDASDGDPEMTVLLVKFKKEEQNSAFIGHLNSSFPSED